MPSSRYWDTSAANNIFRVFEPMLFFPPRTSDSVDAAGIASSSGAAATTNSLVTTSTDQLETGHLLWEAVDTALSQLSIEYKDNLQQQVVRGGPSLIFAPFSAALSFAPREISALPTASGAAIGHLPTPRTPPGFPARCRRSGDASGGVVWRDKGQPIPILYPLGWAKQSGGAALATGGLSRRRRTIGEIRSPGGGDRSPGSRSMSGMNGSGGVNHLNLIQIMGRTAHAWQPHLVQDPYGQSRSAVMRPDLMDTELNWVLLTRDRDDQLEIKKTR